MSMGVGTSNQYRTRREESGRGDRDHDHRRCGHGTKPDKECGTGHASQYQADHPRRHQHDPDHAHPPTATKTFCRPPYRSTLRHRSAGLPTQIASLHLLWAHGDVPSGARPATACPPHDLLDIAATELNERGTRGWTNLELRTTQTTGTALVRRVTFTYWTPATTTLHPQQISYHTLWAHRENTDRTALLKLTVGGTVSLAITRLLTRTAGSSFFVRDPAGDHRLPTSFRIFLHTMARGRF